jgi:DNA-binding protein WhiA
LQPGQDCCLSSELAGLIAAAGRVIAGPDGELSVALVSGHATVARHAYHLLRTTLGVRAHIRAAKRPKLDKATYFTISAGGPGLAAALAAAGITDAGGEPIEQTRRRQGCCRLAFLRGAWLGSGFMADPRRSYHWEVTTPDRAWARSLRRSLAALGIRAGLARRRQEYVVYLKDAEGIAAWLNLVGAHQALLSLENARIYKDMKNRVNRLVNCETANLSRTINAGLQQQEAIRLIEETVGLGSLPDGLREVAEQRLANAEATLEEIGASLRRPVGKSGVNHRLREIRRIAAEIEGKRSRAAGQGATRDGASPPAGAPEPARPSDRR